MTYTTFFTSYYPRASNDYRSYYLLPDSGSLSGGHIQFQAYAYCFDIEQINEGCLAMTYHGTFDEPTAREIQNGFEARVLLHVELYVTFIDR